MAPMHEGKIVKPEVFNTLPETMRKEVEQKIEALQKELETILERVPKSDKQRRQRTSELNEEVAKVAVREALDDLAGDVWRSLRRGRLPERGGPRSHPQRRAVSRTGGRRERDRQAVRGHRTRCAFPPIPGQRHRRRRRHEQQRCTAHRGAEPDLRQRHRPRRAPGADGRAGHGFPADQARRPAQGQRRLPADRRAQAAAVAVRLGGA